MSPFSSIFSISHNRTPSASILVNLMLLYYYPFSDMALGCILAQLNDLGKERTIHYLSTRMLEYKCKYIMIERLWLALVWATRRLRHYVTEYSILLVSRLDPVEVFV